MGVSTDGILCFGVDLGEGEDYDSGTTLPWLLAEDDDGFDDWLAEINGVDTTSLWAEYETWIETQPQLQSYEVSYETRMAAWEVERPGWQEEVDFYSDKKKQIIDACPVEIVRHCSGDYPMYIVAVRGSVVRASRGNPETISIDSLTDNIRETMAAEEFCRKHGIPFEDPQWLLASLWW